MSLKTDYKNYVPTEDMGGKRRYRQVDNPDGTVSFDDATTYEVEGNKFGADDINQTNSVVNTIMGAGVEVTYEESTVKITAPTGATMITFIAPSSFSASDKYTINGESVTITDLNGEPLDDAWKQGSPVTLTLNGNKAFFKSGGGVNQTLPLLLPNFKVDWYDDQTVIVIADMVPAAENPNLAGAKFVYSKDGFAFPNSPVDGISVDIPIDELVY